MENLQSTSFGILLMLFITVTAYPQDDVRVLLQNLEEEEIENIDALAIYPEDTRLAILQACLYPEVLIKIKKVQEKTSQDFVEKMDAYPKSTQQKVWDLTRYPDMIKRLINLGPNQTVQLDNVLADYPEIIHNRAKDCYKNHYQLLEKVDQINNRSQLAFDNITQGYNEVTQDALDYIISLPEVMTILTDNIEVSILVGDAYKNYPEWVLEKADSMHLALARAQAEELEDWKKRVEENPELKEELEVSAEEFAVENNYDDLYYDPNESDYPEDDLSDKEYVNRTIEVQHYHYHYPYWYGYPSWYYYPRWRPYPFWFDFGFHHHPRHRIVINYLPSYYFVDWYFNHPHHHSHYPHLSAHFVHHYHGHRRSVSSISTRVRTWRNKNKAVITEDLIANSPRRINTFREFGEMEQARDKYNRKNPNDKLTQSQFVNKEKKQYKKLTVPARKSKAQTERDINLKRDRVEMKKPEKRFPSQIEKRKTEKVTLKKKKRTISNTNKIENQKKTLRAKEIHKKNWEKSKRVKVVPNKTKRTSRKNEPRKKKITPKKKNN